MPGTVWIGEGIRSVGHLILSDVRICLLMRPSQTVESILTLRFHLQTISRKAEGLGARCRPTQSSPTQSFDQLQFARVYSASCHHPRPGLLLHGPQLQFLCICLRFQMISHNAPLDVLSGRSIPWRKGCRHRILLVAPSRLSIVYDRKTLTSHECIDWGGTCSKASGKLDRREQGRLVRIS